MTQYRFRVLKLSPDGACKDVPSQEYWFVWSCLTKNYKENKKEKKKVSIVAKESIQTKCLKIQSQCQKKVLKPGSKPLVAFSSV